MTILRYSPLIGRYIVSDRPLNVALRYRQHDEPPLPIVTTTTSSTLSSTPSYLGIELPMKPTPPEEGECCMSGCAHCIYDVYLEDLQLFHQTLVPETRTKLINILRQRRRDDSDIIDELIKLWPENTLGKRPNLTTDDDDEESKSTTAQEAKQVAQRELRKVRNSLDPATRAFLEMEEKIKNKKK